MSITDNLIKSITPRFIKLVYIILAVTTAMELCYFILTIYCTPFHPGLSFDTLSPLTFLKVATQLLNKLIKLSIDLALVFYCRPSKVMGFLNKITKV